MTDDQDTTSAAAPQNRPEEKPRIGDLAARQVKPAEGEELKGGAISKLGGIKGESTDPIHK